MRVTLERAGVDDGPGILRLLEANGLPLDGVLEHLTTALVARVDSRIVGCAALEIYTDGALLRSVAVDSAFTRHAIGTRLTTSALELARSAGVPAVYLLTTTADGFFPRFGFGRIARDEVPAGIRSSVEFQSACPASATVMRLTLRAVAPSS